MSSTTTTVDPEHCFERGLCVATGVPDTMIEGAS